MFGPILGEDGHTNLAVILTETAFRLLRIKNPIGILLRAIFRDVLASLAILSFVDGQGR